MRIDGIECSTVTGTCQAEDVDVSEPDDDPSNEVSDEDGPSVSSNEVSDDGPSDVSEPSGSSNRGNGNDDDDVSDEQDVSEDD